MNDIVFTIIKLVVVIVVAAIATYGIPFIKAELGDSKTQEIINWVNIFVQSAEMLFGNGTGEQKLNYVIEQAKNKFNSIGISITEDQLRAIIESAVYTYCKNKKD